MSTDLTTTTTATSDPIAVAGGTGAALIREAAAVMADAHALAKAVAGTQMIPRHFQGKPDECAAAMLYGASLGLDPMQSVRQIYVVHGQAALYARAMSALVQGAGHKVWTVESTDQSVTVSAQRRGSEHIETSTWTFERAEKAGYTNNSKYKSDPQAMLYSKAVSEVCRKIAPDVLSGVYSVEEMQMEGRAALARPATVTADAFTAPTDAPEATTADTGEAPDETQRRRMFALFNERRPDLTDRDDRLRYCSLKTDTDITSSADMTAAHVAQVVAALEDEPTQAELIEDDGDGAA